jgi:hypothetical protein
MFAAIIVLQDEDILSCPHQKTIYACLFAMKSIQNFKELDSYLLCLSPEVNSCKAYILTLDFHSFIDHAEHVNENETPLCVN